MMLGSVAIAPVGGWIADDYGWRAVFLVRVPLLLLAAVLGRLTVPSTPARPRGPRLPRPDRPLIVDVLLIGTTVTAGLLALEHSGERAALAIGLAALAVGLGVYWARRPASRVYTDLVRRRVLGLPALALLCNASLVGLLSFSLPFFISDVLQRSPEMLGTAIACFVAAGTLFSLVAGILADRYRALPVATAGAVLIVLALLPFLTLDAQAGVSDLAWRMFLLGAAMPLFNSPNVTAILSATPGGRAGSTGGITNLARTLGNTIGPAVAALAWTASAGGLPGYRAGVLAMMTLCLAAVVALLVARSRQADLPTGDADATERASCEAICPQEAVSADEPKRTGR
ncbi:hypothetical protein N566_05460 [Streptomycetaceae bacterium MP113-05]|nr:hypothetical protein N566_05460 [Streptomycetaceae bacterium MP113-05]